MWLTKVPVPEAKVAKKKRRQLDGAHDGEFRPLQVHEVWGNENVMHSLVALFSIISGAALAEEGIHTLMHIAGDWEVSLDNDDWKISGYTCVYPALHLWVQYSVAW